MITVVEGVSAGGKTTWCGEYATGPIVPEFSGPQPPGSPTDRAKFWVNANSARWVQAIEVERSSGEAWCDTDPCKLHYTWGMYRLGLISKQEWDAALKATKSAFEAGKLGLADRVVFLDTQEELARKRRAQDPTRRRGRFEIHIKLLPELRRWYEGIDELEPGRVQWIEGGPPPPFPPEPREGRSDPALLDAVVAHVRHGL